MFVIIASFFTFIFHKVV